MYKTLLRLALYKSRQVELSRAAQPELAMYNLYEARANLSRLVDRVLDGEEIVIARAGRPLVKLVPFNRVERRLRD